VPECLCLAVLTSATSQPNPQDGSMVAATEVLWASRQVLALAMDRRSASSVFSYGYLKKALVVPSIAPQPGVELRHFRVDPIDAVEVGYRYTVVAIQDEVEAPNLVEAHRW
jgi:hypothetical protein